MIQSSILTKEPFVDEKVIGTDDKRNNTETTNKIIFSSKRKIFYSQSFNCLQDIPLNTIENTNTNNNNNDLVKENNNNNLLSGLRRRCNSLNEIYFLQKTIDKCTINLKINSQKANSTGKIDKCVRFNDNITITELNDEYDRKPMPLAKMYYKDQVELNQLREQMRQIQYRIINNIEGKVLLDE
ncbi:hypothetical protein H8356DRAFT_386663 [Neocallimastix lanati (nom. inval.)]|jgi:hypothetical protein|uniref:Uncharacterized protein n=1 Tax=Neocallimastix californiae TaxID=1754190 RepID=A0A1Y2EZ50_9FUNG|nr:hypothetical protein H8356DRAFT_386663 [Neocallimastix sp. JGI-2020a]ORY76757.1 hypothetical protein LY90DRAFT_698705 [Neocallimastix californiae]|eukprot:ORY76757.1 hypothetical protein LY90DRAFT_698705 [Neocallimastix californiae]